MHILDAELKTYASMRRSLEESSMLAWVVIRNTDLIGTFSTFDEAANAAVEKFGRGPYLIRQVGAPNAYVIQAPRNLNS